jgi:alpha-beta hydrolase superfamily lysophospholipase
MRAAALLLALASLAACHPRRDEAAAAQPLHLEPVQLTAADGVAVYATHSAPEHARALILLFHQAGSGQGEYATIAPRLNAAGYATLTVDARAGGDLYGGNWTVKKLGHAGDYLSARQDLEAALAWADQQKLPVILWGSSYSASLVLALAAKHPVKAVFAFSPGEYFDGKLDVRAEAAKVTSPLFVTSAHDAEEEAAAKAITDASPATLKRQYIARDGGVHGSSTLNPDKNPASAPVWAAVMAFLDAAMRG